jgi:mannose-6-phosphate isomerase-like protein (cupin superfamily)
MQYFKEDGKMPVIRATERPLSRENRPEWSRISSAGLFVVPAKHGRFDCHYHDCDEYWLVFEGKARIMSEGVEYYVRPGDIICTKAGDEHDVIEVYEDLNAFWVENALPECKGRTHFHKSEEKAKGHEIIHKAVPDDFPE